MSLFILKNNTDLFVFHSYSCVASNAQENKLRDNQKDKEKKILFINVI